MCALGTLGGQPVTGNGWWVMGVWVQPTTLAGGSRSVLVGRVPLSTRISFLNTILVDWLPNGIIARDHT